MSEKRQYVNAVNYYRSLTSDIDLPLSLKSNYETRVCILQNRLYDGKIPKVSDQQIRCKRCSLLYKDAGATYKILPVIKKTKFAKKIIKKIEKFKVLTKYQDKYYKKITINKNFLEVTCSFCCYKDKIPLNKPIKPIREETTPKQTIKKGKKRKSDKFCGLNKDIVNSVIKNTANQTQKELTIINKPTTKKSPQKNKNKLKSINKCKIKALINQSGNKKDEGGNSSKSKLLNFLKTLN